MMSDITVQELRKARTTLETDVSQLLTRFEEDFGVTVVTVTMHAKSFWGGTSPQTATPINNPLHQCSIGTEL